MGQPWLAASTSPATLSLPFLSITGGESKKKKLMG